ncbi:MAG: hypothetical protein KGI75_25085 [Rhizobiaceae bacterium]|nr:hypothetical protein [Rhizobiaceae bacterium]
MSLSFRRLFVFADSIGHIGSAVRAAEEFERCLSLRRIGESHPAPAVCGIPL